MKSKHRIGMKNFHKPQQQFFVLFLVGMQLIFLVFLVFHFVDLEKKVIKINN